jgi:hypothetical protein
MQTSRKVKNETPIGEELTLPLSSGPHHHALLGSCL